MENEMMVEPELERRARGMDTCLGCARPKAVGLVVCWDCFKRRQDVTSFKYWAGDLAGWLEAIKAVASRKKRRV